jgi:hypothetical protein
LLFKAWGSICNGLKWSGDCAHRCGILFCTALEPYISVHLADPGSSNAVKIKEKIYAMLDETLMQLLLLLSATVAAVLGFHKLHIPPSLPNFVIPHQTSPIFQQVKIFNWNRLALRIFFCR